MGFEFTTPAIEKWQLDEFMSVIDEFEDGLIGTVDSIQQTLRYAGCVASQKDYMAGILTMGEIDTASITTRIVWRYMKKSMRRSRKS